LLILGLILLSISLWRASHHLSEDPIRTEIGSLWTQLKDRSARCEVVPPPDPPKPQPTASSPTTTAKEKGIPIGYLNFALGWSGKSDLDLVVIEPSGEEVCIYMNCARKSSSNGKLDIDSNACAEMVCTKNGDGQVVENISWETNPPKGLYKVYVALYNAGMPKDSLKDISFNLEITYAGETQQTKKGIFVLDDIECGPTMCKSKYRRLVAEFEVK